MYKLKYIINMLLYKPLQTTNKLFYKTFTIGACVYHRELEKHTLRLNKLSQTKASNTTHFRKQVLKTGDVRTQSQYNPLQLSNKQTTNAQVYRYISVDLSMRRAYSAHTGARARNSIVTFPTGVAKRLIINTYLVIYT